MKTTITKQAGAVKPLPPQMEDEPEPTPGPWHINTLETVPYTVHSCRGHVADVSRGTMNEVGADECEANARLIASAPELLAALIKCNLELRAMHSHYHPTCEGGCPFEDATNQARAAIAKAKAELKQITT